MTDWPTEATQFWLAAGLLMIAWTVWRIARRGLSQVLALDCLFVWSLWIGYHLTPWLALDQGGWTSFLLVPAYVDAGLAHSTLSMAFFVVGSSIARGAGRRAAIALPPCRASYIWLIVLLSLVVLMFSALRAGGFGELLFSSVGRGHGQWEAKDFVDKVIHNIIVANSALWVVLAVFAAWVLTHTRCRSWPWQVACVLGVLVSVIPLAAGFSRASGAGLLVFALFLLGTPYRRRPLAGVVLAALALHLCWVGYTARGDYMPGIGNFTAAAWERSADWFVTGSTESGAAITSGEEPGIDPGSDNFLNALDPWTLRAHTAAQADEGITARIFLLVSVLQPIPSAWVPFPARVGKSLSVVKGTVGSTGLTTPALGELYYLFGQGSSLFFLVYGWLCGLLDRRYEAKGELRFLLWKLLVAAGFIVGLHSGLRAMTRFALYGLILLLVLPWALRRLGLIGRHPRRSLFAPQGASTGA